eukprot:m.227094 g.227094  ORF g.227094 m.227094 type:complete len:118 (+) comp15173_c0_seq9:3188-3541(+)
MSAAAEEQLPTGWVKRESKSRPGFSYYLHEETKTTQWEKPTTAKPPTAKRKYAASDTTKVRASHILAKHAGSRRPSSWREPNITRSLEEAKEIIRRKLTESRMLEKHKDHTQICVLH